MFVSFLKSRDLDQFRSCAYNWACGHTRMLYVHADIFVERAYGEIRLKIHVDGNSFGASYRSRAISSRRRAKLTHFAV